MASIIDGYCCMINKSAGSTIWLKPNVETSPKKDVTIDSPYKIENGNSEEHKNNNANDSLGTLKPDKTKSSIFMKLLFYMKIG